MIKINKKICFSDIKALYRLTNKSVKNSAAIILARKMEAAIFNQTWPEILLPANETSRKVFEQIFDVILPASINDSKLVFYKTVVDYAIKFNLNIKDVSLGLAGLERPDNYYFDNGYYVFRRPKHKLLIEIQGGNVIAAWAENEHIELEIIDWDSIRAKQRTKNATRRERYNLLNQKTTKYTRFSIDVKNVVYKV